MSENSVGEPDFVTAIFATLVVLVMGYPCALGMATPLAIIRGGGVAAQKGILMRSGEAFQAFKEETMIETLLVFLCGIATGMLLLNLARWLGRKLKKRRNGTQ